MALTGKARQLRKNQIDAERVLWRHLRNSQLLGQKFRRQFPIDAYIADFVCLEASLVVELDGGQHAEQVEYDRERTERLQQRGFRVIRFWNNEVLQNTSSVLEAIRMALLDLLQNRAAPSGESKPAGDKAKQHF